MFSACVTSRSSSHRANQQECSPPCLTNFSPRPHNSHQTRFLSCVWRRLIKWYHSGCVLCLEASQAACAALHFCGFPPPCSVLGSVENYKHVATSIAATSRVWVGWDATSKKSDWWQAVRNVISAHPGGWHVACPSTSVTLHERDDNFLISVSFLTSTLNKSHWKIDACHVKGDTRTGKVCRCYSTLSKHQTEGYENSQPHYGPFLYTKCKTIRTCCRRYIVNADWRRQSPQSDVISFESSGEAAAGGTAAAGC